MTKKRRIECRLDAFSLVPQDPKDEPASVLLDRIREERANQPKAKTAKKSKAKTTKSTGKRGRKKAQPPEPPESDNSEPIQLKLPGIEEGGDFPRERRFFGKGF
ncbi:hypothetical protein [Phormidium sp. CCY1219]|uniref:hypothetical protein n=1 Tax=Phormidium sp. CCY1219 TaxID=2886104 RepID=UPI002D1F567D|nr:hypothetical protein [Phormidium sp. CCY1219]MEB3826571.1 hypothetical protein [Phormidium sp. CCY1219]